VITDRLNIGFTGSIKQKELLMTFFVLGIAIVVIFLVLIVGFVFFEK